MYISSSLRQSLFPIPSHSEFHMVGRDLQLLMTFNIYEQTQSKQADCIVRLLKNRTANMTFIVCLRFDRLDRHFHSFRSSTLSLIFSVV